MSNHKSSLCAWVRPTCNTKCLGSAPCELLLFVCRPPLRWNCSSPYSANNPLNLYFPAIEKLPRYLFSDSDNGQFLSTRVDRRSSHFKVAYIRTSSVLERQFRSRSLFQGCTWVLCWKSLPSCLACSGLSHRMYFSVRSSTQALQVYG